jgi:transcriptional regulator with XRE-family HTH domain
MIRTRKAKRLTQKQVGSRVGTSQAIVSMIESGEIESSSFILPICKVLAIAPPQHHGSEEQKQWSQLGHLLRMRSPKQFRQALALVESMLEEPERAEAARPTTKPDDDKAPARK